MLIFKRIVPCFGAFFFVALHFFEFAITQHVVVFIKGDDGFRDEFIGAIIDHGNPMAIIDSLTLCPNLVTGHVCWGSDFLFRDIPTDEIQTALGCCGVIDK